MRTKRYTVTEIVAGVYCEQKVVLDRLHGSTRSEDLLAKANHGVLEHARFERNGYASQPTTLLAKIGGRTASGSTDRRCFVASHVFGSDAEPTHWLRSWRDQVLTPTIAGRAAVRLYYLLSPAIVRLLMLFPRATPPVRAAVAAVVRCLGGPA